MSQQLSGGTIYTNTTPGNQVNATNLNNLVDEATLTNGAVIDQSDVDTRAGNTLTLPADMVLLGDSTAADTAVPLMVPLSRLLPQSLRDGTQRWGGVAGGSANAITLVTSPASTGTYVTGETVRFKTAASANTGAVTVNLDGRGVVNLYNVAVAALVAGDLPANAVVEMIFDGTEFQVVSLSLPAKAVTSYQAAEKLRADCQQYATSTGTGTAYALNLLDSSGAPTFTALYDGMMVKFKVGTTNTGAVTLAVNGLGTPSLVTAVGGALVAGQLATGQMVVAVYDLANTVFKIISQLTSPWGYISGVTNAPTVAGLFSRFAHGLVVVPTRFQGFLTLTTSGSYNNGYSVGDVVPFEFVTGSSSRSSFSLAADATYITVIREYTGYCYMLPKGGGGAFYDVSPGVTNNNWQINIYASL